MPVGPAAGGGPEGGIGPDPVRNAGEVVALTDRVRCRWTDATAGDSAASVAASPPRSRLAWLRQVHGAHVVLVGSGKSGELGEGDALVAPPAPVGGEAPGLCILTADCASIALAGDDGSYAAVHAGWRGLVAGVVDGAAGALRAQGAVRITGALGPCIHPECYEFSPSDLSVLAGRFGDAVRSRTGSGRPAFDLPVAVSVALAEAGIEQRPGVDACTSCQGTYFSHRARADVGRQALLVWGAV